MYMQSLGFRFFFFFGSREREGDLRKKSFPYEFARFLSVSPIRDTQLEREVKSKELLLFFFDAFA